MSNLLVNKKTNIELMAYLKARNAQFTRNHSKSPSANDIIRHVSRTLNALAKYFHQLNQNKKTQIQSAIDENFRDPYFILWLKSAKSLDFNFNIESVKDKIKIDTINRHRRGENTPKDKLYQEFYAIYSGYAGIKGFEQGNSLFTCFDSPKKFEEVEANLIPPIMIQQFSSDVLVRHYQAKEDFYSHYTGFYNIFFIDEVTIRRENKNNSPIFEVANFVFENQKGAFYYKELKTENLKRNDLFPLENSPKSNFYIQEIDADWAYMFSFDRPKNKKGIVDEFPFFQLGSTQKAHQVFSGIGYAFRVETPFELILPQRELSGLNPDLLRMRHPITTVQVNDEKGTETDGDEIYKELFQNSNPLNETVAKKLPEIEKILSSKKNLYYHRVPQKKS